METLWNDISNSPEYSPPEWHGEELLKRKNAVEEGSISYSDRDKAKSEIRKEVS